jgi:hypothetical protein
MTEIERVVSCLRDDFDILTTRVIALERAREAAIAKEYGIGLPVVNRTQGFVSLNKIGAAPVMTGVLGPDSNAKRIMDYKNFIEALLDLDCYGLNVTEEVRNAARKVLGR